MALFMALWMTIFPAAHPAMPGEGEQLKAEIQGDRFYAMSNSITGREKAAHNIKTAIDSYEKALGSGAIKKAVLVKYVRACDFKYRYLTETTAEKKKAYEAMIKRFEPLGVRLKGTKEYNYAMALLWGRRGEITQDVMDNANKDIAEKIKKYAEALYGMDKAYEGYFACKILGRIHYIAPNIPFVLGWPDKGKSKAYLEEVMKGNPENSEAKMFLADTLWALGEKKKAKRLYREVSRAEPGKGSWFYDSRAIKLCNIRMKKLAIL